MIRRLVPLVVAGLLLSGCGSISAAQAMASWTTQSNYVTNAATLLSDVRHAANALRVASTPKVDLHTLCAVLFSDAGHMEQSLPTPDNQATDLLNRATADFAQGATTCYDASHDAVVRARALALLVSGASALSEASVRVTTAALT